MFGMIEYWEAELFFACKIYEKMHIYDVQQQPTQPMKKSLNSLCEELSYA
jgi:hypothetical protein